MNSADPYKVWEIRTLKRKPNQEEARKFLERIAKQVQPIMRNHKWRVKLLSEFIPKSWDLLGMNYGRGEHVQLRLRMGNGDDSFIPYHEVLDIMLHELCHNAHWHHNASFYKLLDELREECDDLINKGISGTAQGFDLPGARLGSLLPSGPNKVGGDKSIMAALSPVQAAVMAAERRLQDNIWCGLEFYVLSDDNEDTDPVPRSSETGSCSRLPTEFGAQDVKVAPRKRNREFDGVSVQSTNGPKGSTFIDLTKASPSSGHTSSLNEMHPVKKYQKDLCPEASASVSGASHGAIHKGPCKSWQCTACTLLNPPLALICELCTAEKPKDDKLKYIVWSCKFCTLENDVKLEKCVACGSWRYSYGAPLSSPAPAPNRST